MPKGGKAKFLAVVKVVKSASSVPLMNPEIERESPITSWRSAAVRASDETVARAREGEKTSDSSRARPSLRGRKLRGTKI